MHGCIADSHIAGIYQSIANLRPSFRSRPQVVLIQMLVVAGRNLLGNGYKF